MESDILKIKVHTNVLQIKFKLGWTSSKPQIRVWSSCLGFYMQAEMDVLGAELAMLVSETEEEVVNNPGDGTVVPSRSSEPHCPIIMVYLWSYNYPHQQLHKLSFTSCHYVMSSQGLRNLTSPSRCHAPHVRCAELLWPHPPLYCRSHHLTAHSL